MGLLGKIGHFIGHNLSEASHAVGLVPGIGPVVGGGLRAAGGIIEGDGIRDSLKNAAIEGVKNYGLGAVASHIPGVSSVTDAVQSKLGDIPGVQGVGDFLKGSAGSAAPSVAGGGAAGGGFLDSTKGWLTGNGGKNALGLLQGANAAYNQQKSSGLANNALGTVQAEWDRRAPLRAQGQAQMLAPGQGIAARIAAVPNRNVYAQQPTVAPVTPRPGVV